MNKVYIFLAIILALIVYLLTKKKSTVVGVTDSNGNSLLGNVGSYVQSLLNGDNKTGENTSDNSSTGNSNTDNSNTSGSSTTTGGSSTTGSGNTNTTGPTNSFFYTYKGSTLYLKFNGNDVPSGGLGFLASGNVVYSNNVIIDPTNSFNYIDKPTNTYNTSGIDINSSLGQYLVNNVSQTVYSIKQNDTLSSHGGNAVGYLANGTVVYWMTFNNGDNFGFGTTIYYT